MQATIVKSTRGAMAEKARLHALNPEEQLCSFAREVIEGCEALNKLVNQGAGWQTYFSEYKRRFLPGSDFGRIFLADKIKEVSGKNKQLRPLGNLLSGLINYYNMTAYDPYFRAKSHCARWPEFKTLIEDECSVILGRSAKDHNESAQWQKSHNILCAVKYDYHNISRPWDFGEEIDCVTSYHSARFRNSLSGIYGKFFLFKSLAIPEVPYNQDPGGPWYDSADKLFSSVFQLASYLKTDAIKPVCTLRDAFYNLQHRARPECFVINNLTIELAERYISELEHHKSSGCSLPGKFSEYCDLYRSKVADLLNVFPEHEWFRDKIFDSEKFAILYAELIEIKEQALSHLTQNTGQAVIAQFANYEFQNDDLAPFTDALFEELAEIERSRTNNGDKSALRVAYGKEELLQLSQRKDMCLFLSLREGKIEGFALIQVHSPQLDESLQPLLQAALEKRGKVDFSYLHLIVFRKEVKEDSCPKIIAAISDCGIRHECPLTLYWCRQDNAANLAFLTHGSEILPGKIRIVEHDVEMSGLQHALLNEPKGLARLMPGGQRQLPELKGELNRLWATERSS